MFENFEIFGIKHFKHFKIFEKNRNFEILEILEKISGNVDSQMHENEFCDSSEIIANKMWHFTTGS